MTTEAVSGAVEDFLEGREDQRRVLAEVARALASQLDRACASESARGLSAAPPLARRLVELVGELEAREHEAAMRAERRERMDHNRNWVQRQAQARNGGEASDRAGA